MCRSWETGVTKRYSRLLEKGQAVHIDIEGETYQIIPPEDSE
jgi:hypothetical protein